VDSVLKSTALRRSADNITVVFVAFDNFFNLVRESQGDIRKFEYKQIELQTIDLLQPPETIESARLLKQQKYQNDILIEDTSHRRYESPIDSVVRARRHWRQLVRNESGGAPQ